MKYEDKPVEKENFLPIRKRPINQGQKESKPNFKDDLYPEIKDVQNQNHVIVSASSHGSPKQEESNESYHETTHMLQSHPTNDRQEAHSQEFVSTLKDLLLRMNMMTNYTVYAKKNTIQDFG